MDPGRIIGSRFVVEKLVGSGGMGAVYAAIDRESGDRVALKVLHDDGGANAQRFADEVGVLSELRHPAIVRYVAHGATPEGSAYLAMEWLEGEDLEHRLARGPIPLEDACLVVRRAVEGLGAAHARGVVHRDVKPSNLFLSHGRADELKLIDFGIARRIEAPRGLTGIGKAIGTIGYMAPEQARADDGIDARADLFALGCVLFECITGKRAFAGEYALAVLTKILLEDPPRLRELSPEVPAALDDLVASMLEKEPSARPANAASVARALAGVLAGKSLDSAPSHDARRATSSPPPGAGSRLTHREQALVSIVMAQEPESVPDALASTTVLRDDPELAAALRARVGPVGARVESLADGSIIAVLSSAASARDQADRAALCALAFAEMLPRRRVVVATGQAEIAARLPIGEVIDQAAAALKAVRKESRFGFETPVIDELTARLVSSRFEVETREGRSVLVRECEPGEPARSLLGRATPCVGRHREILLLDSLFERCASERKPRAALVVGPAGIGKSRVRYETLRRIIDRPIWPTVVVASGDPTRRSSPLEVASQLVRHACGANEEEPAWRTVERLRNRLSRLVEPTEVDRIAAFLAEAIGAGAELPGDAFVAAARRDGRLMADQIRQAWLDWLVADAASRPMVFAIDDLHAADASSLALIDDALRELGESAFLVIGFARLEIDALVPDLWAARDVTRVELPELSVAASVELVRAVLGDDIDVPSIDHLVSSAGGNAFYLEEMIRASVERRSQVVPPTVLAMAQSRVLGLDREARRVLRAASVFGRVFWRGGVDALLGDEPLEKSAGDWLEALAEGEVVTRRATSRFSGDDEFAFRHALLVDASYSMLVDADRELGHSLAGQWLDAQGERDAGVIATHFDRSGERFRAIPFYLTASEQALSKNDPAAAVACSERGALCGATGLTLGKLRLIGAEANMWRGDLAEVERDASEALELFPAGSAERYASMGVLVAAATSLGHHQRTYDRVVLLTSSWPEPSAIGSGIASAARMASHLATAGLHPLCDRLLAWIDALAKSAPHLDDSTRGLLILARGLRAAASGDLSAFLLASEAAAEAFAAAGDLRRASGARANVGFASAELGRYPQAERALRDAIRDATRTGATHVAAYMKHNLGAVIARRGALDEARGLELEAIAAATLQGDKLLEAGARIYLARILALSGDRAGAVREASDAASATTHIPARRAMALGTLASVLPEAELERALACATEAVSIAEELGGLDELEASIRLTHAELTSKVDPERAAALIRRAGERLVARASMIREVGLRASFLDGVEENARTMALCRKLDLDASA